MFESPKPCYIGLCYVILYWWMPHASTMPFVRMVDEMQAEEGWINASFDALPSLLSSFHFNFSNLFIIILWIHFTSALFTTIVYFQTIFYLLFVLFSMFLIVSFQYILLSFTTLVNSYFHFFLYSIYIVMTC